MSPPFPPYLMGGLLGAGSEPTERESEVNIITVGFMICVEECIHSMPLAQTLFIIYLHKVLEYEPFTTRTGDGSVCGPGSGGPCAPLQC